MPIIIAVALYDWLITFQDERSLIWSRKVTGTTVLFVLNRYIPIIIFFLAVLYDTSPEADNKVRYTPQMLLVQYVSYALLICFP